MSQPLANHAMGPSDYLQPYDLQADDNHDPRGQLTDSHITSISRAVAPTASVSTATPEQSLALTPAKRALAEELYEEAHCAPKRHINKDERLQHEKWAMQRLAEEFHYCIKNKIRPQQLRSLTSPTTRLTTSTNPWNDFVKSRYFESRVTNNGDEVPKDLILRQKVARTYWREICSDNAEKAACLAAMAMEQAESDQADSDRPTRHARLESANLRMIRKARMRLQASLSTLATTFSQQYGIEMYAIASSNLPETSKERFIVASPGGQAFMGRRKRANEDWRQAQLMDFTDAVTGQAFLEETRANAVNAAWTESLDDKNLATKTKWYSAILKDLFDAALVRRSKRQGKDIETHRFVYNTAMLKDKARIIVRLGQHLLHDDFRSPTGKRKFSVKDLDRIIPLLRAGELSFDLEEELPGARANTENSDSDRSDEGE
ncbi:BQ5605_C047g12333 [Microbotryum silenes-dioicae]|uniref:BQ5605_C047g12333 protein n=1 Tax=Microbotryum silenes-dioicae TaxID=796604 RepID=A0A2X0MSR7_9BASI|nr:BQ5605_C047g12333 [Microbotryum silenes-dioicae]